MQPGKLRRSWRGGSQFWKKTNPGFGMPAADNNSDGDAMYRLRELAGRVVDLESQMLSL